MPIADIPPNLSVWKLPSHERLVPDPVHWDTAHPLVNMGTLGELSLKQGLANTPVKAPDPGKIDACVHNSLPEQEFVTGIRFVPKSKVVTISYLNLGVPINCRGKIITGKTVKLSVFNPGPDGRYSVNGPTLSVTSMLDKSINRTILVPRPMPARARRFDAAIKVDTILSVAASKPQKFCDIVAFNNSGVGQYTSACPK